MSVHKLPSQTLLKLQSLKCSECSYITAYPNALQVHRLKAHAKDEKPDKPYKCGICSYQTSFRSNLQKHQRVHTGEKPYVCACCCMRFSFRSNHKRHEQRCLAVRGLTPFQNPPCGLTSSRYATQPSYSLPSTNSSSSVLAKPETCGMDTKQGQFSLALNQFELPQDENQRAMMDFYYKAFHDPTTMMVAPAGLSLPHLTANPMAGYPLEESEFKVKIKQEPVDGVSSLERATRGIVESTGTKGRTSCPRKQSHPRKTQSEWLHATVANIQEDIKPNLAELDQEAAMDCRTERASRHCERDNIDSSQEDLKHSSRIRIFSGSTRTGQCSRSRSPRNHCIRKIKKENRASSPMSLNDVQRDGSPVRRTGCSTSTSATPSSVADTETNCSLPFTLDAVLGDLSLGNLIDMLVQNGRIYRCHHCKILFEEYATYILHMGCHGSTNPFSCHFCGVGFHEKFGFLTHFMKCVGK